MSSQSGRSIGDQELALLQFISERAQATVAEAVEGFGQPRGLARSTVLTMMERLRRKGFGCRRAAGNANSPPPGRTGEKAGSCENFHVRDLLALGKPA